MSSAQLNTPERPLPGYVAVEGPIGVGKTTLAKKLAETFNYDVVLERAEENPFLDRFYRNKGEGALATQLFFLFQRAQQVQDMRQADMFQPVRVADFLIQKDKLFAQCTLSAEEYELYEKVYAQTTIDAPVPDLVIYLQAPADILQRRIQQRGMAAEQYIERAYLERLNNAYCDFFHYYNDSALMIVNASQIDFANNENHYQQLLSQIVKTNAGRHYFNPSELTAAS